MVLLSMVGVQMLTHSQLIKVSDCHKRSFNFLLWCCDGLIQYELFLNLPYRQDLPVPDIKCGDFNFNQF